MSLAKGGRGNRRFHYSGTMRRRWGGVAAGLVIGLSAQEPFLVPMTLRATAETWKMPSPGEHMGMLGVDLQRRWGTGGRFGLEGWGSLRGERGGFIATGLSGGWSLDLVGPLSLEADVFVGGGGVGRAGVGGGMMTRGSLGLQATLGSGHFGLSWSRVRFPNGLIDSRQVALTAAFPFRVVALAPSSGPVDLGPLLRSSGEWLGWHRLTLLVTGQRYQPTGSARTLSGVPDREPIDLVGEETRLGLGGGTFVLLDLAAAARGKADGYMDAFLGLGWARPLDPSGRFSLVALVEAGAAGGGSLDVGGGAAFKALVGLEAEAWGLHFGLHGGWMTTPGASFKARVLSLQAGKVFQFAAPGGHRDSSEAVEASTWSFRAGWRRLESPQRRGGAEALPIDLVGLRVAHDLNDAAYLAGEAGFAMTGKAGGFAQGLVGAGLRSPTLGAWGPRLKAELMVGAAGGGGVDTRGGLLFQPMAGLEQGLGSFMAFELMAGRCVAPRGELRTTVVEAGLALRFSVPARR